MKTIKRRLILSYSFISFLIIVSLAVFYTISMESVFSKYAKEQLEEKISSVVSQMEELYQEDTGKYEMTGIEIIGNAALQNGLLMHVKTTDGELDWDIRTHKEEECQIALQHAENNMHGRYLGFDGKYQEKEYMLESDGKQVGTLTVGYYGPYSYTDSELQLLGKLNQFLVLFASAFVFLAVILGGFMSRKFTRPISSVIDAASHIAQGQYGIKIEEKSKIAETQKLINAINEMSKDLEKEEKQKQQISADVAHELRTPLTNLQGQLEAIIYGIWEPTDERLESCHEEVLRLINIVKQLQELYVLENRKDMMHFEKIDFYEMCKKLYWSFSARLEQKQLRIRLLTKNGDMIWADRQRIMQCMTNLMSNAIRYSEDGSEIQISYHRTENHSVCLEVQNRGKQIPNEALEHLFERFYRVDKSRNMQTGGMGIGLSITKAIIDRHGGKIWATSDGIRGTIFYMELPEDGENYHKIPTVLR